MHPADFSRLAIIEGTELTHKSDETLLSESTLKILSGLIPMACKGPKIIPKAENINVDCCICVDHSNQYQLFNVDEIALKIVHVHGASPYKRVYPKLYCRSRPKKVLDPGKVLALG